jgi:hypothetical protein
MHRLFLWGLVGFILLSSIPFTADQALAIPAFARKYDLPCSMCHAAFPKLNAFGLAFRDNGYQMGSEKDNPVNQPGSYWPIAIRTVIGYQFTTTNNQDVIKNGVPTVETVRTGSVQDLGIDLLSFGTLAPNVSYNIVMTLPGEVGLESAWVRLDNLAGTKLLNFKAGIFEPDIPFPTKRILTLTADYLIYDYHPAGSTVEMGLGENQTGVELMGHEDAAGFRYSVAVVEGNNTEVSQKEPISPDLFESVTYQRSSQRVGLFAYQGSQPTQFLMDPTTMDPIDGTGYANRKFIRTGADLNLNAGPVNLRLLGMIGMDPKQAIDTDDATAGIQPAARDAKYNGGFVEVQYQPLPILIFDGRYDVVRNTQQSDPAVSHSEGNQQQMVLSARYYLNISTRTDLALHAEFSQLRTTVVGAQDDIVKNALLAFDFAF